jgi:hypothetical protein
MLKNTFEKELRSKKNYHQINLVEIIAKHREKYAICYFYVKRLIPTVIITAAIYIYLQGTDNNIRYQHLKEIFVFVIYTLLGTILESLFNIREKFKFF